TARGRRRAALVRGRRPALERGPAAAAGALDHEVHELARDDDRLARLAAVEVAPHALSVARTRDKLFLAQTRVDLEPVAHPAVHLHDELERLANTLLPVGLRPRRLPQTLVPEHAPQLLGGVRRVRVDQGHGR